MTRSFISWFILIVSSGACPHFKIPQSLAEGELTVIPIHTPEPFEIKHPRIRLGGYSGLALVDQEKKAGIATFYTHTDRGPILHRPRLVEIRLDINKTHAEVTRVQAVTQNNAATATKLPNTKKSKNPSLIKDEQPDTESGKSIDVGPMGLDLEGVALGAKGSFWMVDEYLPSIVHLNSSAQILERFVPKLSQNPSAMGTGVLPAIYASRQLNRGFEGVASWKRHVFAVIQSPIDDDPPLRIRIVRFNARKNIPDAEYFFNLDSKKTGKIGGLTALGPKRLLAIEQNSHTNKKALKKVYELQLEGATNLLKVKDPLSTAHRPAKKRLVADLVKLGLGGIKKIEGITYLAPSHLVLIHDNDFGLTKNPDDSRFKPQHSHLFLIKTPTHL